MVVLVVVLVLVLVLPPSLRASHHADTRDIILLVGTLGGGIRAVLPRFSLWCGHEQGSIPVPASTPCRPISMLRYRILLSFWASVCPALSPE
jgi:hypothetical protein